MSTLEERVDQLETQLKELKTLLGDIPNDFKLVKTAVGELVDKHNDVVTALEQVQATPARKGSTRQAPLGFNPASLRFIASESRQWLQLLFGGNRRR